VRGPSEDDSLNTLRVLNPQALTPFHPDWSLLNLRVVPFEIYREQLAV